MAAIPTTSGIFNSSQFTQDLVVKDFDSMITRYMPNGTAPIFGISAMLKTETAVATEHGFFTKSMVFPGFVLTADITTTTTTFTVASTENLIAGQVHELFQTKENIIINQILSPTTFTVQRGIGSTPAAITVATQIPRGYMTGNAYEEGSLRPNALAVNPVRITNLTQIFRNSYAITGTAAAVSVIAGDDTISENRRDGANQHSTAIETALLFGKKSQGVRNGQPFRTMDGLVSIVSNLAYYPPEYTVPNVYTAATSGTDAIMLEDMLNPVFNQATDPSIANERLLFVGGDAALVINRIAMLNGEYKLVDGQTNWGLQFKTLQFARGKFTIIEHPLLNTNPDWRKMAIALDISTFNLAYLNGRKTVDRMFNQNGATVVDQGIDAMGGTLTSELTTLVRNPPANAIIYNLTKALKNPAA